MTHKISVLLFSKDVCAVHETRALGREAMGAYPLSYYLFKDFLRGLDSLVPPIF